MKSLREYGWTLFFPLSLVWAAMAWCRRRAYSANRKYRSPLPVIGIGNVHSGGSGKTPLVLEIARHFEPSPVVIISRGYGGKLSKAGGKLNLAEKDGPGVYGDEPWMMASQSRAAVYVGQNRLASLKEVEASGRATDSTPLVLLDDGFQRLGIARSLDIVAIQVRKRLDSSHCLPYGELREPLANLRYADGIVLVHESPAEAYVEWRTFLGDHFPEIPVFGAQKRVEGLWDGGSPVNLAAGMKLGGFCGLASPEGFLNDLSTYQGSVLLKSYPDHHHYAPSDIDEILEAKRVTGVDCLVTTDKDAPKVLPLIRGRGESLYSLRIRYDLSDDFWYFLRQRLELSPIYSRH